MQAPSRLDRSYGDVAAERGVHASLIERLHQSIGFEPPDLHDRAGKDDLALLDVLELFAGHDEAMNAGTASRLAWMTFGLVALCLVGRLVFSVLNATNLGDDLLWLALFSFPLVGILVASRQPRHPIAWILLGDGFAWQVGGFIDGYARYGLNTEPGSLPQATLLLALTTWWWVPAVGLMGTFLILLFPDGRLPSPRWRRWAWLSAITMVIVSLANVVTPGPLTNAGFPHVRNPLGVEALRPIIGVIQGSVVLLVVCSLGCVLGLIQRFRRSHGQERLQLKWLTAGAAFAAISFALMISVGAFVELSSSNAPPWSRVLENITFFSFALVPIAIGIAILRYHLYDIDVIINRTLVYGTLTAVLGLIYVVGVVGGGTLVRGGAGEGSNSLVVAASTLAVAALFRPVRGRVQGFIDRRFYRHRYDAVRTVEDFSRRLRDQVALDTVISHLLMAVHQTLQPTHASLWLRKPSAHDGGGAAGNP